MEFLLGLMVAIGLGTAAGLNAYIPLLVLGLLDRHTGYLQLGAPWDALANGWGLLAIAVVAALDLIGDKIPVIDHGLHVVGVVVHPLAGAVVALAASQGSQVDPLLAGLAGLVLAGGTHGARAAIRPLAGLTTGGVANPALSTIEDTVSLVLSVLSVVVPMVAFILVLAVGVGLFMLIRRLSRGRAKQQAGARIP